MDAINSACFVAASFSTRAPKHLQAAFPQCLQLKGMRKEVAELLRSNKQESARIRVEAVIRENALLQAYDVLELFLELLAVRVQLVERSKDVPLDMTEALASLVYSAQRVQARPPLHMVLVAPCAAAPLSSACMLCGCPFLHVRLVPPPLPCHSCVLAAAQDFPELLVIRAQLAGKYGKEYISEWSSDQMIRKWHVNENLIR